MARRHPMLGACVLVFAACSFGGAWAETQSTRNDSCSAGITCDCDNVKDAGILTRSWRADCRKCESRIVDDCRQRYAKSRDALQSIKEAVEKIGYCTAICSVIGPNPAPLPPDKKPRESQEEAALPGKSKPMRLLCSANERLAHEEKDGAEATGCTKGGKRNGLWILRDTRRGTVIEVQYRDGREIWRRERKAS